MRLQFRLSGKERVVDGLRLKEVLARMHTGTIDQYAKTGVFVPDSFTDRNGNKKTTWKEGAIATPRISYADPVQVKVKKRLDEAKARLNDIERIVDDAYAKLTMEGRKPPRKWLQGVLDGKDVDTGDAPTETMLSTMEWYIANHPKMAKARERRFRLLRNIVARYEEEQGVTLVLETLSPKDLRGIMACMGRENSANYAVSMMKSLRSFVRWANGLNKEWRIEPLTSNNPFVRFAIGEEQYGTPFFLTLEELQRLEDADLPPRLARQRDIFVFHCLIGCRVSDLVALRKDNVIEGAVEYIPRKTKEGRPVTIRVPLNARALAILERYKDCGGDKLLPFVAKQQYNLDIKDMVRLAGIDRLVTILNPLTRQEERRPIWEVASSHMARRTFIGNIYKQVKDPNLVGKLTGHKEGSRSFARYRDIDEDMARELVDMLV